MIINSGEEASFTNNTQEGGTFDDKASTSSRLSSALKSQRIVRVSRVFGGKDRHTKVSTVRGLRDRRVRLSVPTAIQLYDLQDKLGLNQPSKVVDWLLDAAQHEIDKLPPLQMPPGNFIQFPQMVSHEAPHQPTGDRTDVVSYSRAQQLDPSSSGMANGNAFNNNNVDVDLMALPKSTATYWSTPDTNHMRMNPKEATKEASIDQQDNNTRGNDTVLQVSGAPYTSYHQWRPSNGYISHLGGHLSQEEATHLFYPLPMLVPPNYDPKQYNYLHMASLMPQDFSGSSNLKPSQDSSAPSRKP